MSLLRHITVRSLLGVLVSVVLLGPIAHGSDQSAGANQAEADPAQRVGQVVEEGVVKSVDGIVSGNTQLALDLYRSLQGEEGNLFVSPHSISTTLAMTYAGARGETARQMAATMHFDLDQDALHPAFGKLETSLLEACVDGSGPELHLANRLWGQQDMKFRDSFLELVAIHYAGGFEAVDFAGATEEARQSINNWVEVQTAHRIRELIKTNDIDSGAVLVLTSAIYFNGTWLYQFDEKYTRDGQFFLDTGDSVTVPFMGLTARLPYYESESLRAVELSYEGERLAMVILVPRQSDGLVALNRSLTVENLKTWLAGLKEREVHFTMPRFQLDDRLYLEKTLAAMGMPLAFSPGEADFSGICGKPGNVWIEKVIHQTFIDVNEQGTEAAAATAAVLKRGGGPPLIRADHPFLFLIRDRETGAILFLGRVSDPS